MNETAKILVVDDDPAMRDIVPLCLQARGIEVDVAADGNEAVTKIFGRWNTNPYRGVLLDCALPYLTGPQVAQQVRDREELEPGRVPLKIGFCTAYDEEVEAGRFPQKAHADFYLRKPADIHELADRFCAWLGGSEQ